LRLQDFKYSPAQKGGRHTHTHTQSGFLIGSKKEKEKKKKKCRKNWNKKKSHRRALLLIIIIIDRSIADAVQKRHAQMRVLHAVCELPIN
jgi:hypothetical protein